MDSLPRIILGCIVIPVLAWLILSPVVFVWLHHFPADKDRIAKKSENILWAVYLGSFFALGLVLGAGLEEMLFFMPSDWGSYDHDGNYQTTRRSIALFFSSLSALFIAYIFGEYYRIREDNQQLHKRIEELSNSTR